MNGREVYIPTMAVAARVNPKDYFSPNEWRPPLRALVVEGPGAGGALAGR